MMNAGMRRVCWWTWAGWVSLLAGCAGPGAERAEVAVSGVPAGRGFLTYTLAAGDHERAYTLFVPYGYTPHERWPLILFLHGIGEAGTSARANANVGIGPAIARQAETFPFFGLFPQSTGGWGADSQAAADAVAALEEVKRRYAVDADRVYLTGLSTGGYGTWALGAKYRGEFAALVPVCGYAAEEKDIAALATIPAWAFHNAGDPFVSAASSRNTCAKINQAGGWARYTEFETLGHNCWDEVYSDPAVYRWLLSQRRREGQGVAAPLARNAQFGAGLHITSATESTPTPY